MRGEVRVTQGLVARLNAREEEDDGDEEEEDEDALLRMAAMGAGRRPAAPATLRPLSVEWCSRNTSSRNARALARSAKPSSSTMKSCTTAPFR